MSNQVASQIQSDSNKASLHGASGTPLAVWDDGVYMEPQVIEQARKTASLPFVHSHVALMPDAHFGMGAAVGSVVPTKAAIIPASVGVDIGCGMVAQKTSLCAGDLPDNLHNLRLKIEESVPVGVGRGGNWSGLSRYGSPGVARSAWRHGKSSLMDRLETITNKAPGKGVHRGAANAHNQLGTLGGGNHFIEVCLDESNNVWVMLHSGSRGIGNQLGTRYITLAREECLRQNRQLPDKNLAWLDEGCEAFDNYMEAVDWAQDYARTNRNVMLEIVLGVLREMIKPFTLSESAVNCHHNYVSREKHFGANVYVTRKGAVRAG